MAASRGICCRIETDGAAKTTSCYPSWSQSAWSSTQACHGAARGSKLRYSAQTAAISSMAAVRTLEEPLRKGFCSVNWVSTGSHAIGQHHINTCHFFYPL